MSNKAFIDGIKTFYEACPPLQKEELRKQLKAVLENSIKEDLDKMVDRWLEPPSTGIIDVTNAKFTPLFMESAMCYVFGFFFSAISISGVTSEKLCMDLLSRHTLAVDGKTLTTTDLSFLFAIPQKNMIKLLHGWKLIDEDTKNKLFLITEIRNTYVHPDIIPDLELPSGHDELKNDALKILTALKAVLSKSFPPNAFTPKNIEIEILREKSKE